MAGSLNHIIADDGTFTMDLIDNLGDAQEALEEAHQFIAVLAMRWGGDRIVKDIAKRLDLVELKTVPVIQPELHNLNSDFRKYNY